MSLVTLSVRLMASAGREHIFPTWKTDTATYRKRGSYRFSPEQRASEILVLDVEIDSYSHERYENKKSNPNYSFYGYAVIFHGAVPVQKVPLEFPKQRVVNANNQHITLTSFILSSHYSTLTSLMTLGNLGLDPPAYFEVFADLFEIPYPGMFDVNCNPKPFDLLGHRESIVKVETWGESQFTFHVAWMLPIIFGDVPLAVLGDDYSDGEDEYPDPPKNDASDPYEGNPPESSEQPDNNPRDYDDGVDNPPWGSGSGNCGQVFYEFRNASTGQAWTPNTQDEACTPAYLEGRTEDTGFGDRKNIYLVWDSGEVILLANVPPNQTAEVQNVEIVRADGFRLSLSPNSLSY